MEFGVKQPPHAWGRWFPELAEEVSLVLAAISLARDTARRLPVRTGMALGSALTALIALHSPYLAQAFYLPQFSQIVGPFLVGLIAWFCFRAAIYTLWCLYLPALLAGYPSLGILGVAVFVISLPLIRRFPGVFLWFFLVVGLEQTLLLHLAIASSCLAYGLTGGILSAIYLPLSRFIWCELPTMRGFDRWLDQVTIPAGVNWFVHSVRSIDWPHVWEIIFSAARWLESEMVTTYLLLSILLGLSGRFLLGTKPLKKN